MKVLWFHNFIIPQIAENLGIEIKSTGGWMVHFAEEVSKLECVELYICFPFHSYVQGKIGQINYYGIVLEERNISLGGYKNKNLENLVQSLNPDVVHIFGTESRKSYAMVEVCYNIKAIDRVCISIQGLVSVYANHYLAYLPSEVTNKISIWDKFKKPLLEEQHWYSVAGEYEIEAIKKVTHILGRTDWDKAYSQQINKNANYHICNEMLRNAFYTAEKWNYDSCEPFTIFFSQAYSPIKGIHIALECVYLLKQEYPMVRLRVAGESFVDKKKNTYYERFILKKIRKLGLERNVEFVGNCSESKMVEMYQRANVFLCASSIENSPNSVCEAMMIGTPCVSSLVGGVSNLIEHGVDGYTYPADDVVMATYYISKLFNMRGVAEKISIMSIEKAGRRHNKDRIIEDITHIYNDIINTSIK